MQWTQLLAHLISLSLASLFVILSAEKLYGQIDNRYSGINLMEGVTTSHSSFNSTPHLVVGDSGNVILIFSSRRATKPYENIYYQIYDHNGKPIYFQDALPVCPQPVSQKNISVVQDGAGGVYVCWQERRGGGSRDRVYVQRINAYGERLWKVEGLEVTDAFYRQRDAKLLLASNGILIVVWTEDRLRQGGSDLWAQAISPTGQRLWSAGGLAISQSSGVKQHPALLWDDSGYWYAVWQERRGKKNWKLFGQKFNLRGERQWNDRGLALTPESKGNCENPSVETDGMNGLICVYENQHKSSNQSDLYIFRLGRFGEIVHHKALCESVDDQKAPHLLTRDSLTFVYWTDFRSGNSDIYGQCIHTFSGEFRWSVEGRPAVSRDGDQHLVALIPFGSGSEHGLLWNRGGRAYGIPDLYLTRFDFSKTWSSSPRAIPTPTNYGDRFSLSWFKPDSSRLWYAWTDVRSTEASAIRLNSLDSKEYLIADATGFVAHNLNAPSHIQVDFPVLKADERGNWLVAWADDRLDAGQPDIWIQKLDPSGKQHFLEGGLLICGIKGLQNVPQLFLQGQHTYVGWMDRRHQDDDLYLQRLDARGASRWAVGGLPLCTAKGTQNNLCLTCGPQGGASAMWTDARFFQEQGFDLYQQVFDSTGQAFLPPNGGPLAAEVNYQNNLSVSCDPRHQEIHTFWMDDRSGNYQIYAQVSSLQGLPMGPPGGIRLGKTKNHQRFPYSVSIDSVGSFVIWSEEVNGKGQQVVKMQGLRNDLSLCWPGEGVTLPARAQRQLEPQLIADSEHIFVAWLESDLPISKTSSLYLSARALDSNPIWQENQIQLSQGLLSSRGYQIIQTDSLLHAFFMEETKEKLPHLVWISLKKSNGKLVSQQQIDVTLGSKLEAFRVESSKNGHIALVILERQPEAHDRLWFIRLN
jgi:hypothetical protein